MKRMIELEEKTVDDAIQKALAQLHVSRDQIAIEIIEEGSRGLFGIGSRPAKIRISYEQHEEQDAQEEVEEDRREDAHPDAKEDGAGQGESDDAEEGSARPLVTYDEATIQQIINKAKESLHTILNSLEIPYTVEVRRREDQILLNIHCDNENFLIGRRGATLDAIQYLVNRISNKNIQPKIQVVLDTSDYRVNRKDRLEKLALRLSQKVKMTGKPVTVSPMNPHDRRIIHLALQNESGIRTLSRGTGFMRRITISTSKNSNNRSRKQS